MVSQFQDPSLVNQNKNLLAEISNISNQIDFLQKKQELLQNSTNSYRDTMSQLLDLQKANTQKGIATSTEAQQNLANATKLYLENQQQFQALNTTIAQKNEALQQTRRQSELISNQLNEQSRQANEAYDSQVTRHNLKTAAIKLMVLIPLLIIIAYFFVKKRESIYIKMINAVGIAVIIKIAMVMHEHFPSRLFKYILILALIALVVRALLGLLRAAAKPQKNWLLKQYKEAYKKLMCPMCEYPVNPGILKYAAFTQSSGKNAAVAEIENLPSVEKYTCPGCGEHLFEKCTACQHTRHSLLPFCENCGNEKK